ncbi:uncharacterized protein LOC119613467 [Lucilia sericata]|uniref:uncharacterized protein LOC119613467 n=1 Tax=Lucilia sericata TaxID=13632 RepID=UPI0018A7FFB8|nr:uncharacterized protein LOC119613467 [Lucilia sericata]
MQFTWFFAVIFALFALVSGQSCPGNSKLDKSTNLCLAERPIHGECPQNFKYNININKCTYALR